MLRAITLGVALTLAAPLLAQNSNTQCRMVGNTWTCDTTQQKDIWGDFQRQIQQQNATQAENMRRNAEIIQQGASERERRAMIEVWARCRKRWNEALEKRDFELADSLVKGCPAASE